MSTHRSRLSQALAALALAVGLLLLTFLGGANLTALGVDLPASVAYQAAIERPALSLNELNRRLARPVRQSGALVIDLTGVTIDLRLGTEGRDPDFAEQFYQRLQQALNGPQQIGRAHV